MTRLSTYDLRQSFASEEFDYVALSSALSDYQAPRQKINELLKEGVIVRVKKGLYVFGSGYRRSPICSEVLANLIYGPSCLSLEYALSFHGLIPERVTLHTSITTKRNRQFDTPLGRFVYSRISEEKYPVGIELVRVDDRHSFLIASAEKALCDYLQLRRVEPFQGAGEARDFLVKDLRVEASRLNRSNLELLNQVYRSENVECLLNAL